MPVRGDARDARDIRDTRDREQHDGGAAALIGTLVLVRPDFIPGGERLDAILELALPQVAMGPEHVSEPDPGGISGDEGADGFGLPLVDRGADIGGDGQGVGGPPLHELGAHLEVVEGQARADRPLGGPVEGTLGERLPDALAAHPSAKVHTYGKDPRPGRKVGHINVAGDDLDTVVYEARAAAAFFLG